MGLTPRWWITTAGAGASAGSYPGS
jgi:hypothetical protein